jgi:3-hydroxyisobutyrate dehydrogenase-like beta-hydroxyacid dehydrogenase
MHVGFVGAGNMGRPTARNILKAGHFVDLAWRDLGLGLVLAAAAGAKTAVGRGAGKLYGQAREAGLGKLDTSGLLGLQEPKP